MNLATRREAGEIRGGRRKKNRRQKGNARDGGSRWMNGDRGAVGWKDSRTEAVKSNRGVSLNIFNHPR